MSDGRAARAEEPVVPIAEEVVPERGRVEERLEHGVHEAGVAEVVEPAQPRRRGGGRGGGGVRGAHEREFGRIWRPCAVIHAPALPWCRGGRGGGGGGEERGGLGEEDGVVEIGIVDLVPAGGAEELGAVDVDGDLVAGARGGGGVRGGVGGAEDGGAGEAGVEAGGRGRGRGGAGRAARELARVPPDLGAAERAHAEAAAEEA